MHARLRAARTVGACALVACAAPRVPAPGPTPHSIDARTITVVAAGDLALGHFTESPLGSLGALLDGELRLANLEGPICPSGREEGLDASGSPAGGAVRLWAPADRAGWLRGRFEVVSLANNHALDQGPACRDETRALLAAAGVATADEAHDAVLSPPRFGTPISVLARAYAPDADLDADTSLALAVRAARRRGPVLVSLHWGHTGALIPTPAQRRLAARLVDAGASAVLGHGPHTLQGVEHRGRAVIAYSLGNLAFGCRCSEIEDAYLLRFRLLPDGVVEEVRPIPIRAGVQRPAVPSDDPELPILIDDLSTDLESH